MFTQGQAAQQPWVWSLVYSQTTVHWKIMEVVQNWGAPENILTKWCPTLMLSLKDRKVNWAPIIPGRSRETTNPPTLLAEESLHLWIDVHCLVIFQPATRQQCCRVTSLSYWSNGRDLRTSENLRPLIAFYDPKKASLSYGNWESPRIFPTWHLTTKERLRD